jgi:hypothetical protein
MDIIGILSTIISPVTNLIDELSTSDEEKLKLKNELKIIEQQTQLNLIEYEKTVIDKKAEIMVAELKQDDNFTKRARPTIVYSGLGILILNNVVLPWLNHFLGSAPPAINIPSEFWYVWGGVAGVYAFKRSDEKIKAMK